VKRTWYENWVLQLTQPVVPDRKKDTTQISTMDDGTEE
jgi:hypothetical protein